MRKNTPETITRAVSSVGYTGSLWQTIAFPTLEQKIKLYNRAKGIAETIFSNISCSRNNSARIGVAAASPTQTFVISLLCASAATTWSTEKDLCLDTTWHSDELKSLCLEWLAPSTTRSLQVTETKTVLFIFLCTQQSPLISKHIARHRGMNTSPCLSKAEFRRNTFTITLKERRM